MNLRDPFEKCLRSVVSQMKASPDDMMLLEHIPCCGGAGAQFLYQGKVYLLGFPQTDPARLLIPEVYEYQTRVHRVVFEKEPVHRVFRDAYQRALFDYLNNVVKAENTAYLCDAYATFLLANYLQVTGV